METNCFCKQANHIIYKKAKDVSGTCAYIHFFLYHIQVAYLKDSLSEYELSVLQSAVMFATKGLVSH